MVSFFSMFSSSTFASSIASMWSMSLFQVCSVKTSQIIILAITPRDGPCWIPCCFKLFLWSVSRPVHGQRQVVPQHQRDLQDCPQPHQGQVVFPLHPFSEFVFANIRSIINIGSNRFISFSVETRTIFCTFLLQGSNLSNGVSESLLATVWSSQAWQSPPRAGEGEPHVPGHIHVSGDWRKSPLPHWGRRWPPSRICAAPWWPAAPPHPAWTAATLPDGSDGQRNLQYQQEPAASYHRVDFQWRKGGHLHSLWGSRL